LLVKYISQSKGKSSQMIKLRGSISYT